jgi:hypothetical protein
LFSTFFKGKEEEKKTEDATTARMKRMFGCVLGAFVGDAAGAVLEFQEVITPADITNAL